MLQLIRPSTRSESHMACFGELNFLAVYFATLSVEDKVVSLLLSRLRRIDVLPLDTEPRTSKIFARRRQEVTFTGTIRLCLTKEPSLSIGQKTALSQQQV